MSEKLIEVRNRDAGSVGYTIPDMNLWRSFAPGETKKIPLSELQALQYVPGGEFTLKNLLMVKDRDALSALNIEIEPEYFYTETEVKELLTKGTLDQLKDCLDFAPEGVIDLIKRIAVDIKLPDTLKREAIFKKTGFSIDNAIMVNKVMDTTDEIENEKQVNTRRANPITSEENKKNRRSDLPKYNVVNIKTTE